MIRADLYWIQKRVFASLLPDSSGKRKKQWHSRADCAITVQGLPCISVFDLYHQLITILNTMYLVSSVYHG